MSALTVIPLDELAEMRLRTTPIQERSRTTLTKLKEAAQEVLADPTIGRDRFTTKMVADLAGVSIGTFYRYFQNRVEILDAIWPDRRDSYLGAE